jgi:hypothetical protein
MAGRQRSQAERRPEFLLHRIDDTPCRRGLQQRERQTADREDLVGPEGRIGFASGGRGPTS